MIVSSAGVRDDLLEHFGGVPDRVVVIPNGIDLQRVDRLSREPCPELPSFDGVTVIMVARLCPGKDFSTLIDAVAGAQKTIRVRLVLVGEGDYQNEIEEMISRQNLGQQVLLLGYQSNPFKFMKRSDCFVLSSFHEGFGNVLVEAMALGLPVLSSDCPTGPREIIENGENGFLFPVGDKDALMSLILRLQSDAELRAKLSRAALQRAQNFESRAMVTRYEDLIEEALNEK